IVMGRHALQMGGIVGASGSFFLQPFPVKIEGGLRQGVGDDGAEQCGCLRLKGQQHQDGRSGQEEPAQLTYFCLRSSHNSRTAAQLSAQVSTTVVSVIIPYSDEVAFLEEAVASAAAQEPPVTEIIVVCNTPVRPSHPPVFPA